MKGYDSFDEKPGVVQEHVCQVCHSTCLVNRNVMGPTGWAESMAKRGHLHDWFHCPHAQKEWHEQALQIVLAIEETPSKSVAELMHKDLAELLAEHGLQTNQ